MPPFFGDDLFQQHRPPVKKDPPPMIQVMACNTCKVKPGFNVKKSGITWVSMCAECWRAGNLYPVGSWDGPSKPPGDRIDGLLARVNLKNAPIMLRLERNKTPFSDYIQIHMLVPDRDDPNSYIDVNMNRDTPDKNVTERAFMKDVQTWIKYLVDHETDEHLLFDNGRPFDPHDYSFGYVPYRFPDEKKPGAQAEFKSDVKYEGRVFFDTETKKKKPPVREARVRADGPGRSYAESKLHGKRRGRYGRETLHNSLRNTRG